MVTNQAYLFLIFIVCGIIIGVVFDFFRILRKVFKTTNMFTYIEDFLFWMITGAIILYSIFLFNNGEIRLFMFLAIGIGVVLYMLLISSYIIKINVKIINFFKDLLSKLLMMLSFPFKYLYKFIKKLFFKPISFVIINIRKNSTNFAKSFLKAINNNKKVQNNIKN